MSTQSSKFVSSSPVKPVTSSAGYSRTRGDGESLDAVDSSIDTADLDTGNTKAKIAPENDCNRLVPNPQSQLSSIDSIKEALKRVSDDNSPQTMRAQLLAAFQGSNETTTTIEDSVIDVSMEINAIKKQKEMLKSHHNPTQYLLHQQKKALHSTKSVPIRGIQWNAEELLPAFSTQSNIAPEQPGGVVNESRKDLVVPASALEDTIRLSPSFSRSPDASEVEEQNLVPHEETIGNVP